MAAASARAGRDDWRTASPARARAEPAAQGSRANTAQPGRPGRPQRRDPPSTQLTPPPTTAAGRRRNAGQRRPGRPAHPGLPAALDRAELLQPGRLAGPARDDRARPATQHGLLGEGLRDRRGARCPPRAVAAVRAAGRRSRRPAEPARDDGRLRRHPLRAVRSRSRSSAASGGCWSPRSSSSAPACCGSRRRRPASRTWCRRSGSRRRTSSACSAPTAPPPPPPGCSSCCPRCRRRSATRSRSSPTAPTALALFVNAASFLFSALDRRRRCAPSAGPSGTAPSGEQPRSPAVHPRGLRLRPARARWSAGWSSASSAASPAPGRRSRSAGSTSDLLGGGDAAYGMLFGAVFLGLAAGIAGGPRLLGGYSRRRLFGISVTIGGIALAAGRGLAEPRPVAVDRGAASAPSPASPG